MTTAKRVVQLFACGLCAAAAAPAALAEAYIGVGAGKSTFDISRRDFDDIAFDAFNSQGAPILTRSSTFDDSDTALTLFAGYRFLRYIGVEAGYVNLGAAEYRFAGTVNPPGPVTSAPAALNAKVDTKGFTVAGVGSLPLGPVVDLRARLGLLVSKTKVSVGVAVGTGAGNDSDSLNSASALFGIGLGFNLGQHWGLGVDWIRYANVGDENDDDDWETAEGFDVDALTFSAAYRF